MSQEKPSPSLRNSTSLSRFMSVLQPALTYVTRFCLTCKLFSLFLVKAVVDSFCSDLLEKLYYYFKVDISDDSCFLIQQNGAIISSDEDDDTNSTKEDWDSQITVSSVLKKDIVDRVLVDNLIVELKKAKLDFDKQKKPAQDYNSEQA